MNANILVETDGLSREEWLRYRKQGIGGSDVAAILGISKWNSAISLWLNKTNQTEDDTQENEAMEWGTIMEPVIRNHFAKVTGKTVVEVHAMLQHPDYTYNVYIKLAGLINKGIAITPDIHREVDNIVRVERQNHLSVIKQIVPKCEVGGLASNKTMNLILKTLTDDIEAFWGKGDYYSSNAIRSKYRSIPDVARLIPAMVEFTANSLDDRQHLYTADIKESFQEYGIMPVGICKDDAHKYQIQEIKGLYNMVTDCYAVPDKRAYHEFPVPHQCSDGRYKAGITFHMVNDTRKQPVSIAKGTIEEYEKAVFIGLKKAYATNVKYHCSVKAIPDILEKSKNDILRFYKVVESKTVKEMTRKFIKTANLKE